MVVVLKPEDYFMGVACLSAFRSKDKDTKVGACIVSKDQCIVGIGYNEFANHCEGLNVTKKHNVVHAAVNAILNKNSADVNGCTMYTTHFPCSHCAKLIIQSQIGEIVYLSVPEEASKPKFVASQCMLESAKIQCRPFTADQHLISFKFDPK